MSTQPEAAGQPKSPLNEIIQPFIDLVHAPRALWGINLGNLLEGMVYFGILGYLAMYFNNYVGLDDVWAGRMVGVLTGGITISMFFFGAVADKWGVRRAILTAFCLLLVGRVILSIGPTIGLKPDGMGSPVHILAIVGIVVIVIGYGMYQPGAYAAIRQFTTPKTAGMGFAMLYALMNLGGWLPTFMPPVRKAIGIAGAYWVYVGFTAAALVVTFLILTKRVVKQAIADAQGASGKTAALLGPDGCVATDLECKGCGYNLRTLLKTAVCPACAAPVVASFPPRACTQCGVVGHEEHATVCASCGAKLAPRQLTETASRQTSGDAALDTPAKIPVHMWGILVVVVGLTLAQATHVWGRITGAPAEPLSWPWLVVFLAALAAPAVIAALPSSWRRPTINWIGTHPFANGKFFFFIFALIPVQTLFAHNWLTLPMYVERAYRGTWLGTNFEVATNFNPILIFILVPMVAAVTQKAKVYNMMILGTFVMAAPTFLLTLGPSPVTLASFLVLMTLGEAMWQPRFLQYAAEIAPEGRTGQYMGVAQFPWFLTKVIVPLYSGWFLKNYCPAAGPTDTPRMWLIYGLIAMCSTVLLILAKGWLGKDFKTTAA